MLNSFSSSALLQDSRSPTDPSSPQSSCTLPVANIHVQTQKPTVGEPQILNFQYPSSLSCLPKPPPLHQRLRGKQIMPPVATTVSQVDQTSIFFDSNPKSRPNGHPIHSARRRSQRAKITLAIHLREPHPQKLRKHRSPRRVIERLGCRPLRWEKGVILPTLRSPVDATEHAYIRRKAGVFSRVESRLCRV